MTRSLFSLRALHAPLQRRAAVPQDIARSVAAMRRVLEDNDEFRGLAQPGLYQRKVGLLMLDAMRRHRRALLAAQMALPATHPGAGALDEFLAAWPDSALARGTLAAHARELDTALLRLALHFPLQRPAAANDSRWLSLFGG